MQVKRKERKEENQKWAREMKNGVKEEGKKGPRERRKKNKKEETR